MVSPGDYGAVVDIKSAYRSVHIYPGQCTLQGFGDGPVYYVDYMLCFGGSSSPFIFNSLTDLVIRIMCAKGYVSCVNYFMPVIHCTAYMGIHQASGIHHDL